MPLSRTRRAEINEEIYENAMSRVLRDARDKHAFMTVEELEQFGRALERDLGMAERAGGSKGSEPGKQ